jgi:diacylglycerol kinase (ATP)
VALGGPGFADRSWGEQLSRSWPAIVNPVAGGGRGARTLEVAARAAGLDLEPHPTRGPMDAARLARELDLTGAPGLVIVGGDGTLHEALQGWLQRPSAGRPPLGILPAGTGDALARDLGIADPASAARALVEGRTRTIDLARVTVDGTQVFCFSVVGWGAFARINLRAERLRWARGLRYDLAALMEVLRPGRLEGLGGARANGNQADLLLGVACLTEHTGRGMRMAPGAKLDDGQALVVEFARGPRLGLLRLLSQIQRGGHLHSPRVFTESVRDLTLELEPGSHVVLDGEAKPARRVTLQMIPGGLEVFAPGPGST